MQKIKEQVDICKAQKDVFELSPIDGICFQEIQIPVHGSILLHTKYSLKLSADEWINIDYISKDKCRVFQVNPDESIINVECSIPNLNFYDFWEEKY